MYVVSVIPIMPRAPQEGLSYYSAKEVAVGSTVRISVGNKKVPGLVVDVSTAKQEKAQIRKAGFSMKKVEGVLQKEPFDPALMKAVRTLAAHYARSAGTLLHAIIPDALLADALSLPRAATTPKKDVIPDIKIAAASYDERISRYKSLTRESFAREVSVILSCPTQTEVDTLAEHIGRGIEDRLFVFNGRLSSKKTKERWLAALSHPSPIVVITTGQYASIPRRDVGLFIIEHESSPHYKQKETPYLDARTVIEHIARARGCDLVLGDAYPRIETLHRYFTHAISDVAHPTMRQEYRAPVHIVDMRSDSRTTENPTSPLFSEEALSAIRYALDEKRRTFLFCVRKGYAPFTVCRDCGSVYTCARCDAPMTLFNPRGDVQFRTFRCGRCGKTEDAQTVCATCRSWRLESYGVGIEHVARELQEQFPDAMSFSVSRDATPTPAAATRVLDEWGKTTSGVLLGTEMAIPLLLDRGFDLAVVVSLDTLTFLPDFRMGERVFHIVSQLGSLARSRVIVQTRTPDYAALTYAKTGDGIGMYRYEETVRREFSYPPFSTFVKVTRRGKKESVVEDLTALQKMLPDYHTTLYPAFVSRIKNTHVAHLLISVPAASWPDEKVAKILKALPPQYIVNVDPESLL
ncbi:MAG: hypothetical protein AMXMBFR44_3610 [Candidatus Campbellbacteria bacterium]